MTNGSDILQIPWVSTLTRSTLDPASVHSSLLNQAVLITRHEVKDRNGHDLNWDPSLTQRVQIDPDQLLDFILAADRDRVLRLTDLRRFNFAFVVNALSLRREFTGRLAPFRLKLP